MIESCYRHLTTPPPRSSRSASRLASLRASKLLRHMGMRSSKVSARQLTRVVSIPAFILPYTIPGASNPEIRRSQSHRKRAWSDRRSRRSVTVLRPGKPEPLGRRNCVGLPGRKQPLRESRSRSAGRASAPLLLSLVALVRTLRHLRIRPADAFGPGWDPGRSAHLPGGTSPIRRTRGARRRRCWLRTSPFRRGCRSRRTPPASLPYRRTPTGPP